MKHTLIALVLAVPLLAQEKPVRPGAFNPDLTAKLVAHEWGVLACATGANRSLVGASGPADDDLPSFITQLNTLVIGGAMAIRQPIIHLYTDKPSDVSVNVRFANGYPTCFDPPARTWANTRDLKTAGNGHINWVGRLDTAPKGTMPPVATDHWIAKCRATDATPFTVGTRTEKYLFYEGAITVTCPIVLAIDGDGIRVTSTGEWKEQAVAIRVSNSKAQTFRVDAAGSKVTREDVSLDTMLTDAGLYAKEAAALLGIWRDHFTKRDGLRLITLLTGEAYDALLPLEVCPKPVETKRVMMLCIDFPTPDLEVRVAKLVEKLASDELSDRNGAEAELLGIGGLAAGPLAKHVETGDTDLRARIRAIIDKLSCGVPVPKPPTTKPKGDR